MRTTLDNIMAHREKAPYRAPDPHEVRMMLQGLDSHLRKGKGKGGFSVKKSRFELPNHKAVDSWRMQDWDYKKPNLPTYARGLFTTTDSKNGPEIVVRGYDKFFNHGEVRETEWQNVERNTRGPYELSVKENGCIIFMSGLDDGTLLVCSKHSTGERSDTDLSHAKAGERWAEKHLAAVGKTKEDLARALYDMNATAVAELCDDEFEEHVLAYEPDKAGLYIHGINLNLPDFVTYPGHLVDKFADEWGFKKVMYVIKDDIHEVKTFLDKVAETGNYDGRDTEGFVIRCQARKSSGSPWEDWFFKYKFEEPYLMYRQWRECTKSVISGKLPRIRKHKAITEEYLLYARRRFVKEPQLTKLYNENHGIIKLRDDFLKQRGTTGAEIIRQEMEEGEVPAADVTDNVVLVPVATIGCGKTTVAVALTKLFDWGHFQNDNIQGRQRRPERFVQALCATLTQHPVTIADRNNHQRRERRQLIDDLRKVNPTVKFVCYQYVHDRSDYDRIRQITRDRVLSRGDNHQTIQAGSKDPGEIITIMEGFLHRFEPVNEDEPPDDGFDLVINLDVGAESRENLETIVTRLHNEFPKLLGDMPTADDMDRAIEAAMNDYSVDVKHDLSRPGDKKRAQEQRQLEQRMQRSVKGFEGNENVANGYPPEYSKKTKEPRLEFFAVKLPTQKVSAVLNESFTNQPAEVSRTYNQIKGNRRIQNEFHVTLIHRAAASQHQALWDDLTQVNDAAKSKNPDTKEPELGTCQVHLERLVWDKRIICFVARLQDGKTVTDETRLWETCNKIAHVTVGTASNDIKPKESNDLLARWLSEGSGGQTGIQEMVVNGHVVLDGTVKGILSRL